MSLSSQTLSPVQAFQPGADLWLVPPPSVSGWGRQIDWYLNFQISRGLDTRPQKRAKSLDQFLEKIQWSLPASYISNDAPLLISSEGRLQARWVLLPNQWQSPLEMFRQALPLRPQKIRVFLPPQLSADLVLSEPVRKLLETATSPAGVPLEIEILNEINP